MRLIEKNLEINYCRIDISSNGDTTGISIVQIPRKLDKSLVCKSLLVNLYDTSSEEIELFIKWIRKESLSGFSSIVSGINEICEKIFKEHFSISEDEVAGYKILPSKDEIIDLSIPNVKIIYGNCYVYFYMGNSVVYVYNQDDVYKIVQDLVEGNEYYKDINSVEELMSRLTNKGIFIGLIEME